MRYFIQFSYFGGAYHGWQNQPNATTVQELLEAAMTKLLNAPISLMGAGRTDTGVHAKEMYAHFEVDTFKSIPKFIFRLNSFLPDDIAVQRIFEVADEAHARFDAVERTYTYVIMTTKDPFLMNSAYFVKKKLDIDQMNKAATMLLGKKDFECFSKTKTDVYTHICDLKTARWTQEKDFLVFTITADRFLRNMVRAIVGTLLNVGTGKYSADYVNTILKSRDRSKAGTSVPAKGLYLTSITYPNTILKNG
ncbi:MAG: tRNA pseudouridine(38-40) synthase TruA [Maribacter sp.]